MTKKTTSIKAELIFFIAALVISVVAVSSFLALEAQKRALTAELKLRGQSIARNLANSVADFMLTEDELSVSRIMLEAMNNKGVMYALVVNDKNRIKAHNSVESLGTEYVEPKAVQELESGENRIIITSGAEGERIMDFSYPVMAKGKLKLGVLRLGIDYRVIEDVIRAAYVRAIVIALFALLLGVAGAFILGITITRPVAALARGAREIGKGNLDARISVKSNNELAELAETFNSMAADLKVAQENAIKQQRMEKELEVARDIQLSLIPRNIAEIKGYKINAFYKAAKEVGGDYYDIIPLNKDRFGIVVGDVSGKGVPAALIMTMARSILHSAARESFNEPAAETLKKLNSMIYNDMKDGMFITIFYGILDIKKNSISMASAGHNDALIYRAGEKDVFPYNPKGFPIGTDPGARFDKVIKSEEVFIGRNDKMVVFTDGITEAMNAKNEEFGDSRLISAIKANGEKGGKRMLDGIVKSVESFVAEAPQSDDIAVVVVEREG